MTGDVVVPVHRQDGNGFGNRFGHTMAGALSRTTRAQNAGGQIERFAANAGPLQIRNRGLDIVFHTANFDATVLDDRIGGSRVAVTRLPNAARIDDGRFAKIEHVGNVGVAHENEVGFDEFQPCRPGPCVAAKILVHRIARCRVNQKIRLLAGGHPTSDGQTRKKFHLFASEHLPMQRPNGRCDRFEARPGPYRDPLCHGMIVIPANDRCRMLANPLQTVDRITAIVHQIACDETGIERPGFSSSDRRQSGPVGMDITENEDFHGIDSRSARLIRGWLGRKNESGRADAPAPRVGQQIAALSYPEWPIRRPGRGFYQQLPLEGNRWRPMTVQREWTSCGRRSLFTQFVRVAKSIWRSRP